MNVTSSNFISLGEKAVSAAEIISAALESANPFVAVKKAVQSLNSEVDFYSFDKVGLVSIGKAAVPMAGAALSALPGRISHSLIVTKSLLGKDDYDFSRSKILQGSHPVPDEKSIQAGREVLEFAKSFNKEDAILFLISGGASALVTNPVNGITLDDLQKITALLLSSGASINEINAVRKHLDTVKGGGLALAAAPAAFYSLILSDVPGNVLDVVASGPTVADTSTYGDALATLSKYDLKTRVPESILAILTDGASGILPETPKPGNPIFFKNRSLVIGSVEQAMQAAGDTARKIGYKVELLTPLLTGEASMQGKRLAGFLKQHVQNHKSGDPACCWVTGGETTVTLTGTGIGGRNQELALAAAIELEGVEGVSLITFATDGEDGQSPAAGAVVTGATCRLARSKGLDPVDFLSRHDSYSFFNAIDASITTGSTGTNVNDLAVLFLD